MILDKLTYKFYFDGTESSTFTYCPEDVFYMNKGKKYKQFYKGQIIPEEIFNELFNKVEVEEMKPEVQEVVEEVKSEVQEVSEISDEKVKVEKPEVSLKVGTSERKIKVIKKPKK